MAGNCLRLGIRSFWTCSNSSYVTKFARATLFGSRMNSSSSVSAFETAKSQLNSLSNEPDNDTKLKIYALFKQASVGQCNTKQPGVLDFVGRAKWSAWNALGSMPKEEASQNYVGLVNRLVAAESGASTVSANPAAAVAGYTTLKVTKESSLMTILLNRPEKKNAMSTEMYEELIKALDDARDDPNINVCVVTGAGDHYCSGNDLNNFVKMMNSGLTAAELSELARGNLNKFVKTFIDFPKILIGLVNGPATGIAATSLGLFDSVYASDKATFHTPFTQLGQVAEGGSSVTFPALMGFAKANEMLMYNQKITAEEACRFGLVSKVFPDEVFQKEAWERVKYITSLPPESLLASKKLVKARMRPHLYLVNDQECDTLKERWQSDECMNAVASFFTRKSKL